MTDAGAVLAFGWGLYGQVISETYGAFSLLAYPSWQYKLFSVRCIFPIVCGYLTKDIVNQHYTCRVYLFSKFWLYYCK